MPGRAELMDAIGRRFVDGFNRRDAEALVALADPQIEFHPTVLVGDRRTYHGHDGLRRWMAELGATQAGHLVRVREVRVQDERSFVLLTEVLLEGELLSPSAMLARLSDAELIVHARAYLTDEQTLTQLGLLDERRAGEPAGPVLP
jgi:hypothetical protein